MNLQLCSPYKKCPFNCPMCIAATDEGEVNNVFNLFEANATEYMINLLQASKNKDAIVITGDTEPTLFPHWISTVLHILQLADYSGKIELQTKNYNIQRDLRSWQDLGLDIVAYSATCSKDIDRIFKIMKTDLTYVKKRLVILLTQENIEYLFSNISIKDYKKFNEITFKALQLPNCEEVAKMVNKIKTYDEDLLCRIVETIKKYTNCSLKVDMNCMDAKGRYEIMRIDGKIYKTWF